MLVSPSVFLALTQKLVLRSVISTVIEIELLEGVFTLVAFRITSKVITLTMRFCFHLTIITLLSITNNVLATHTAVRTDYSLEKTI